MGIILNKSSVLDRIKQCYNLKGNAELARFLGVAPNTISNWYGRNTFDLDILYTKCVDIDFNWLFTGNGSMLRNTQDNPIITSTDQPILTQDNSQNEVTTYLYKLYKEKDEENKSLIKQIGCLEERIRHQNTSNSNEVTDAFTEESSGDSTKDYAHMRKPTKLSDQPSTGTI